MTSVTKYEPGENRLLLLGDLALYEGQNVLVSCLAREIKGGPR